MWLEDRNFPCVGFNAALKSQAEDRMGLWISRSMSRNTFPTLHPAVQTSPEVPSEPSMPSDTIPSRGRKVKWQVNVCKWRSAISSERSIFTESWNDFGVERTLRSLSSNPCSMSRDTFTRSASSVRAGVVPVLPQAQCKRGFGWPLADGKSPSQPPSKREQAFNRCGSGESVLAEV